jgi:hypothetical protein
MRTKLLLIVLFVLFTCASAWAQEGHWWHGIKRTIHYKPSGKDFLLVNGKRRFNRALYGGNSAFRVEAGDLPEFALYLPGMGGNLKFGLLTNANSKWIIDANHIESRYRPGSMIYTIRDSITGKATITITALALNTSEGLIVKIVPTGVINSSLVAVYGGATGQKFSRDGDIGADPESSFYLKPEYCQTNKYTISNNEFSLLYGSSSLSEEERYEIQNRSKNDSSAKKTDLKMISGVFPAASIIKVVDAAKQESPFQLWSSIRSKTPAIAAQIQLANKPLYFLILNGSLQNRIGYENLAALFNQQEERRASLAGRIVVNTPDPYINTIGGALSMAADAIWEDPSYMHGAIAWRMRLNGWRGPYVADVLGWHDRAKKHFGSYALSQVISPPTGPVVMDTSLHLARGLEKMGTSFFSSGYISRNPGGDLRPHHYDMNLVFIDELINHFYWTGDTAFLRQMWPVLVRHLDWEKRNFDIDGDGLYDAYAAIWASDALQYSGGGVAHSSAYNYRSNKMAAYLSRRIGVNGEQYQREAERIRKALNLQLWLPSKGWYGEYKDLLGEQMVHPSAALWTIYHLMDSDVPDRFQAYQMLKYVDHKIPHIPIRAVGLKDTSLYTLSTTNWQPYTWSLNNVALGELLHTSLAYWQGGRSEEAFRLWKSTLVESMYLSASPGNFEQISFYDAARGELYRDFADGIGMAGRSLIEGLFGIEPNLLEHSIKIQPGFPASWDHASLETPDIKYSFKKNGHSDLYQFNTRFEKAVKIDLLIKARSDQISGVNVNGKPVAWKLDTASVGQPFIQIVTPVAHDFTIQINWSGEYLKAPVVNRNYYKGESINLPVSAASIGKVYDPQGTLDKISFSHNLFTAVNTSSEGVKTFFIKLKQGSASYWYPVSFTATEPVSIITGDEKGESIIHLVNRTPADVQAKIQINYSAAKHTLIRKNAEVQLNETPSLKSGTNRVSIHYPGANYGGNFVNWDLVNPQATQYEKVDLSRFFNDKVTNIFKHQYLSPRPKSTTLQLPTQGIGNWAYPLVTAHINDSGLRKRAGVKGEIIIKQGIPFATSSLSDNNNIVFTSQWDNYPKTINIPLTGEASHAYLLMAGSTDPMQSRMVNGLIDIVYSDGSKDSLVLRNPENWWPVEQDYYDDGYAFTTGQPKPVRIYLQTGEDSRTYNKFMSIKGFTNRAVDGGAATVLDLSLDPSKELKSLTLKAVANDVIIGLMSVTLVRN